LNRKHDYSPFSNCAVNCKLQPAALEHGDTVLVAAWKDDDQGTNSGSVYLYTRDTAGRQDALLTYPSNSFSI